MIEAQDPQPGTTINEARVRAQIVKWQQRLLDQTKANPLLGINRSRVSKLRIIQPDSHSLFQRIAIGAEELTLPLVRKEKRAVETEDGQTADEPEYSVEPGQIGFEEAPIDLFRRTRRIFDNARTTVTERGVTTLFLSFGILDWDEPSLGGSRSPLLMVPCELTYTGPTAPLKLGRTDEEIEVNPALELYLRERHKVVLATLPDEPGPSALHQFLEGVRTIVAPLSWTVTDEMWLSTYTFESLAIYKDLAALADIAVKHPIVAALARATPPREANEALGEDEVDPVATETELVPVLDTDSSQLHALRLAASGRDLVVHGPPGTGKSQTISNLIADALGRGQKVLFVSAKMAALEVVYARLAEQGLGRFCLEAHSTKAGKAKIIEELRRTLTADLTANGEGFAESLEDLQRLRAELNVYVQDLHARRTPLNRTLHEVLGRTLQLAGAPDVRGPLPWAAPLEVPRSQLNQALDALADLGTDAGVYDGRAVHPWRGLRVEGPLAVQEEIDLALKTMRAAARRIGKELSELKAIVGRASASPSLARLRGLAPALREMEQCGSLPPHWAEFPPADLETSARNFELASDVAAELSDKEKLFTSAMNARPADAVLALQPAESDFYSWSRVLRPAYWSWRSTARSLIREGASRDHAALLQLLTTARRIVELERWFDERRQVLSADVPEAATRDADALRQTGKAYRAAIALRSAAAQTGLEGARESVALTEQIRDVSRALVQSITDTELAAAFERVDKWWPHGFVPGQRGAETPMELLVARIDEVVAAPTRMAEWVRVQHLLGKCTELGLGPFVESLGATSAHGARAAFERRFLSVWAQAAVDSSPALRVTSGARREEQVARFARLDHQLRSAALGRVKTAAAQPAMQLRRSAGVSGSEVQILQRELLKRRNIRPLRKLFAEIPHALQALKPCLLMSPLSVSTFLKPDAMSFDLVVFDEASQLPPHEAIAAIVRATQVVVAGDAKQLPPSSFFSASVLYNDEEEEEGEALEPLESLLDDCVAIAPVFSESRLKWHYRSKDERLIKFSNHYFYDNELITFPSNSTGTEDRGVRLEYVAEGVWDRGRSRTNRAEAHRAAEVVIEQLHRFPDRSIGVVAMNVTQREAIEDAISALSADRPELQPLLAGDKPDEPFFVKSLENVQGDERDSMIISVGYAKTATGPLSLNFGPLNMGGGWRRLNVLVTRAKWQTILVTSIHSGELADVNPNNAGAMALRNFIAYAERKGDLPVEATTRTEWPTNDFEDAVAEALRARGLTVDQQVGASGFRIDMAIRDARDVNRYVLGIECDGVTYHSARTARDRDILRHDVLRSQGWRLHRLWSTDWWQDPGRALEAVLRSLELARQAPLGESVPAPVVIVAASSGNGPRGSLVIPSTRDLPMQYGPGVPYERFRPAHRFRREGLMDNSRVGDLALLVKSIVEAEGPIHISLLTERLKELHGVERAGTNIQSNIEEAIGYYSDLRTDHDDQFVYANGAVVSQFRIAADGVVRSMDQISPEELELAILHLVEQSFGIARESVPAGVVRLFGVERARSEAAALIRDITDGLVDQRRLRLSGLTLYLP